MSDPEKNLAESTAHTKENVQASSGHPIDVEDDSDPDFDDLDDVLDQFSANTAPGQPRSATLQSPSQPAPVVSEPDKPPTLTSVPPTKDEPSLPSAQKPGESESDFIERLSKEMSTMINAFSENPSNSTQSPEDLARMGKELEEFTQKMEQEGIKPEDLLKALLGEEEGNKIASLAHAEHDKLEKSTSPPLSTSASASAPVSASQTTTKSQPTSPSASKPAPKSFEDTIRSTMSRLGESDKSATTAVHKSTQKSEEDLLADMLKALDAGPSGGSGGDGDEGLSKMFLDMMQQLTHKDLLYEPMKELNTQYPSWLAANKSKLDAAEYERYTRQSKIVDDITKKFEEPGFSDDDPACKDFIWERMQKMQDEGAPPEELVKNPLPGTDFGGIPGLGGGGGGDQLPQGLEKELEDGCPAQ